MFELETERGKSLLEEQKGRVINVLVVRDEDGRIEDSLDPNYRPETLETGEPRYFFVSDTDTVKLPKLVDAGEATAGFERLRPSHRGHGATRLGRAAHLRHPAPDEPWAQLHRRRARGRAP